MNSGRQNLLVSLTLSLCVSFVVGQASTSASAKNNDTASEGDFGRAGSAVGGGTLLSEAIKEGGKSETTEKPAVSKSTNTASKPADAESKPAASESGSTMPLPRGPNGELPTVLDPTKYSGQVRAGYAACKEIPQICDKLFCYCGCDLTDCHGSLLDCFTNEHGEDCHICQEEAIIALKMHKKGKTLTAIQKEVDKKFEKEYPFEVESPALQKYKANRLWDVGKKKAPSGKLGTVQQGAGAPSDPNAQPKRKLKPDGSCCAGKD